MYLKIIDIDAKPVTDLQMHKLKKKRSCETSKICTVCIFLCACFSVMARGTTRKLMKEFHYVERICARPRICGHPVWLRGKAFADFRAFEIFAESRGFSMKHAAYLFAN